MPPKNNLVDLYSLKNKLNKYDIKKKLVSCHKFNEEKVKETVVNDLKNKVIEVHMQTFYGACMCEELHTLFHKEFTYYDSTLDDFIKFSERIIDGYYDDFFENNNLSKSINYEYIEYLSIGISNLIDIFEPEAVSIGGSFVYFADVLLDKLKNNIQKKKYLFNTRKELIIIPAALGNDAGIIGACQ